MKVDPTRPSERTMYTTFRHILKDSGVKGLFRGILPRIGVASWATICMVGLGDQVKEMANSGGKKVSGSL